jgi:hypothetical protein
MSQPLIDWDSDLPINAESEYQALKRSLERRQGFGVMFVLSSEFQDSNLMTRLEVDLPNKSIKSLLLDGSDSILYEQIETINHQEKIDALFIHGLERLVSPSGTQKTISPILNHLNQHREKFRDTFNFCLVFVIPHAYLREIICQSPDFFDWKSGVFDFLADIENINRDIAKVYECMYGGRRLSYTKYTYREKKIENISLAEINDLILLIRKILDVIDRIKTEDKINILDIYTRLLEKAENMELLIMKML